MSNGASDNQGALNAENIGRIDDAVRDVIAGQAADEAQQTSDEATLAAALPAAKLLEIDSAASTSGATESLTFTGMLSTDTILSLTMKTQGANPAQVAAFGSPGTNSLSVTFSADPGAGAVVRAAIKRA